MRYSRRDVHAGTSAGLLLIPAVARAEADDRIREIENALGGRIGVSAENTANGARIRHRGDERFAICSTFKATLASAVLARCDRGDLAEAALERRTAAIVDVARAVKAALV